MNIMKVNSYKLLTTAVLSEMGYSAESIQTIRSSYEQRIHNVGVEEVIFRLKLSQHYPVQTVDRFEIAFKTDKELLA